MSSYVLNPQSGTLREYTLKRGINTIGRSPDNMLCIPNDAVSRYHSELYYNHEKETISIKDLSSTNGTYVNGKRIQDSYNLEPGDQILIGSDNFVLNYKGPPKGPPKAYQVSSSQSVYKTSDFLIESIDNFAVLISETGALLENSYDLEKAFAKVSSAIKEMIDADQCKVNLLENGHESVIDDLPSHLLTESLQNGTALILRDTQNLDANAEKTIPQGITSRLIVPIVLDDEPIALVYAIKTLSKGKEPFDQRDLQLVAAIGYQISNAIERKRVESELLRNPLYDPLTGLPNRALFYDRVRIAIDKTKRDPNFKFAILYIDLDNFKQINDSYGHTIGDKVLIDIANRISENLRSIDTIGRLIVAARIGGDEFAIYIDDIKYEKDALVVANRLVEVMEQPFTVEDKKYQISLSIGITVSNTQYANPEEMIKDADTAMYKAKEKGTNRIMVFDSRMLEIVTAQLDAATALRQADESAEFVLYYQPIVSLVTGRIVGLEALLRWDSPIQGFLFPDAFIHLSDTTGLINKIDGWVIQTACTQLAEWQQEFPMDPPLYMSINLAPKQIRNPGLIELVEIALQENQLEPSSLCLEIAESVSYGNEDITLEMLKRLHESGVSLFMDDYGTGYSALVYLMNSPITAIKIDKSFISEIETNPENTRIIHSVKVLADQMGISIIAEGVETPEQVSFLKNIGCEFAQGYYFTKPLSEEDARNLLAQNPQW
jgi:diguanylate cyclase (GGDEF)-like protein